MREIVWQPTSCKAEKTFETTYIESARRQKKIVLYSVFFKALSLNYSSCQQIWSIEKEKDREHETVGDRPAKLNEKKSNTELERETKNKGDIFCWKSNMKILQQW